MEAQREEDGWRILLGDNTGGEAVVLRPIKSQCVRILDLSQTPLLGQNFR